MRRIAVTIEIMDIFHGWFRSAKMRVCVNALLEFRRARPWDSSTSCQSCTSPDSVPVGIPLQERLLPRTAKSDLRRDSTVDVNADAEQRRTRNCPEYGRCVRTEASVLPQGGTNAASSGSS
jgi:hypothetical protein